MAKRRDDAAAPDAAVSEPSEYDHATDGLSPVARVRKDRTRQLAPQDIQPEGAKWGRWAVVAGADDTIEDALSPRYLWGKADQIRPLDYIEIKHPYGFWCVCLDVVKVDHAARGIHAYVRHVFDFTQSDEKVAPDLSGARVEFLGGRQWAVVDGHHVVKDAFSTRQSAEAWLGQQRGI